MATKRKKPEPKKKKVATRGKRKPAPAKSHGLAPKEIAGEEPPAAVEELMAAIRGDGGVPLAPYREPLAGRWVVLAALPIEKVEPTPFQRDVSEAHVDRLVDAMKRAGLYLDPIVSVRHGDEYWTPNGGHRLAALKRMGAKSIMALVASEREVMFKILALNTEKAHALRERALEVIRMARELAKLPGQESDYVAELEEPSYLTLGVCYEHNGRFAGSAYQPVLKRIDTFLDVPLPEALEERERRAERLLDLEDEVARVVKELKEQGFESPYLRAFVIARINPLRFQKAGAKGEKAPDFDKTLDRMIEKAAAFDVGKVKVSDLSRTGGAPSED